MRRVHSTLMVALMLSNGWVACSSPSPSSPNCTVLVSQSRPVVAVEGSWEIMLLASDGTESLLYVRIGTVDGGTSAACNGAVPLDVAFLSGDQIFAAAPLSGCFKVTSCTGDGVLSLNLGDISLSATLKSDGTVVSTNSKSSNGTMVILGGRTAL